MANVLFPLDIFANFMHRNVPRPFDHHLHIMLPGDFRQLAKRFQFGKLRLIVRIGDGAGAQAVAKGDRDIVLFQNLADFFKMRIQKFSSWWAKHHWAMIEPPRETMPVVRLAVSGM